ncbi:MAG: DNA cytosine methyltransferase [Corynebacterium sp.]|nr:DNA cytosine methyltransferase [Corynebacterium sp.]
MTLNGVELFAGGGGLLLGSSLAGVHHSVVSEWNKWACATIRDNVRNDFPLVRGVNVLEGDVRNINWAEQLGNTNIDILTAGPPCQPFSVGGVARSAEDPRDMFPATAAVIATLQPKAFVIENVKGLTRPAFAPYFEYIKLRLTHPELRAHTEESWEDHYARLQKKGTGAGDLHYNLTTTVVNAADYGVPQNRHRVFIVGFREDVQVPWSFPQATHSAAALRLAQDSGEYWDAHRVPVKDRQPIKASTAKAPELLPWRTVRDALSDLPEPTEEPSAQYFDHKLQPGAKSYPGHTGSPIDAPSKALKAGVHGVPGGENMIRYPDGRVRYYSIREAARIQTFPDEYQLHGAWSEAMRQLGNAVPVQLAETVVASVTRALTNGAEQAGDAFGDLLIPDSALFQTVGH